MDENCDSQLLADEIIPVSLMQPLETLSMTCNGYFFIRLSLDITEFRVGNHCMLL